MSATIAALFGQHAHAYQALSTQAAAFHTQFVQLMNGGAASGTLLVVTESGFDKIPSDRRAEAFLRNDGGWAHQTRLIEKYLAIQS